MTIIAGFKSWEGVVICADTQETTEHSKRRIPKLVFEPRGHDNGSTDDLAVAFCGSSDNGPFVDKLIASSWEDAQTATSLDEVCKAIEVSIKSTYAEFGRIYQRGYCPSADLIYGVKMYNGTKLFSAHGPVVNEKHGYESSGIGYYMADFLSERMYRDHLNLRQCVILAAYVLFQAKEHVEGCGGDSHIAVLRDDGVSGRVGWTEVEAITEMLKLADEEIGRILFDVADFEVSDGKLKENANGYLDVLCALRDSQKERIASSGRLSDMLIGGQRKERDSLGLPKLSGARKSEPEQ